MKKKLCILQIFGNFVIEIKNNYISPWKFAVCRGQTMQDGEGHP